MKDLEQFPSGYAVLPKGQYHFSQPVYLLDKNMIAMQVLPRGSYLSLTPFTIGFINNGLNVTIRKD